MQAPLQVYARMLAEKAQQQRALQRADAVEADRMEDASSEDEEGVAGNAAVAQPSAETEEALAASALPLARRKPSREAPLRKPCPQVGSLRDSSQPFSAGKIICIRPASSSEQLPECYAYARHP